MTPVISRWSSHLEDELPATQEEAAARLAGIAHGPVVDKLVTALKEEGGNDQVATAFRQALRRLTKSDFKRNTRAWMEWWQSHGHLNRLHWLIDGLDHRDRAIRADSAAELAAMDVMLFDYSEDLPVKKRVDCQKRIRERLDFLQWWQENANRSESALD